MDSFEERNHCILPFLSFQVSFFLEKFLETHSRQLYRMFLEKFPFDFVQLFSCRVFQMGLLRFDRFLPWSYRVTVWFFWNLIGSFPGDDITSTRATVDPADQRGSLWLNYSYLADDSCGKLVGFGWLQRRKGLDYDWLHFYRWSVDERSERRHAHQLLPWSVNVVLFFHQ